MKGLVVEAAGKICLREDLPLPEIDAYQVLWDLQWDGYAAHKRADAVYPVSVRAGA